MLKYLYNINKHSVANIRECKLSLEIWKSTKTSKVRWPQISKISKLKLQTKNTPDIQNPETEITNKIGEEKKSYK